MKIAICVPSGPTDSYGQHTRYAEEIVRVGKQRSMDVEILRNTDKNFYARLMANLADGDCIVHFHCFLYDLKIACTLVSRHVSHVVEHSEARTLATISDHPYEKFMQEMIRDAHLRTRFIVIDDCFSDEMKFVNPSLTAAKITHLPFVPPVNFDEKLLTPFNQRTCDLILPLFLMDLAKVDLNATLSKLPDGWLKKAIAATYEIALTDASISPFRLFSLSVANELGGTRLDEIVAHQPEAAATIIRAVATVDGIIRHIRRHRMVQTLLRSVGKMNVLVMGNPVPSLKIDERVRFVGYCQSSQVATLMANSKATLNCNPTYPNNIHERVSVGMLYESCVITDVNPCISKMFSPNEFVSYSPQSSETLEDIFGQYDISAIAEASARKVRDSEVFSWGAHFDELLKIAAT